MELGLVHIIVPNGLALGEVRIGISKMGGDSIVADSSTRKRIAYERGPKLSYISFEVIINNIAQEKY